MTLSFGGRQHKKEEIHGEAKIDIKIGQIQFSGQGEQEWVAKQLDKIIAQAEKLIQLAPLEVPPGDGGGGRKHMEKDSTISRKTLPVFLSEKGSTKNQVKKFLATAVWLEAKGQNRLGTVPGVGPRQLIKVINKSLKKASFLVLRRAFSASKVSF